MFKLKAHSTSVHREIVAGLTTFAGISFGFISTCIVKLVTGRGREVSPILYVLSVLFVVFYVFHPAM